ncbi:MAG: response regulator [Gammaproteobacteria bacterium]|nr:MAG: response regulator [Gammaproteobacteria bacterium]
MRRILVVEDEPIIRNALRRLLEKNQYQVSEAASVASAESDHRVGDFDLIISDLRLPGAPGTDLIKKAGQVPVLIMTSYASLRNAVDAMRLGAADYIAKPFNNADMLAAIKRNISKTSASEPRSPASPSPLPTTGIVGSCEAMVQLYKYIEKAAPTNATVLVQGETGVGKELVARSIHQHSKRGDKPLICVNCAAIPDTLIESELFGYEKGAFTGANANRMGLIEAADQGTLFLDEIGELPLEAQARLLRFIQEGEIRRIGAVTSRQVDVRLICATHRNLRLLTEQGAFRQDLFYRVNVLRLEIPPLRDRGSDILEIAESLLKRQAKKMDTSPKTLSPDAVKLITTYHWPGNVRELEHALERAVILSEDDTINADTLGILSTSHTPLQTTSAARGNTAATPIHADETDPERSDELSLEEYFQRFVLEHQDSMSETELAKKLGVSRKCLWERRQRFGIPRNKVKRIRSTTTD